MRPQIKAFMITLIALIGALLLLIFILLIYTGVKDYKPLDIEQLTVEDSSTVTPIPLQQELNFVAWNIGYAGLGREMDFFYDGGRQVRPDRQLQEKYWRGIKKQLDNFRQMDFIMLLEVDRDSKRSYYLDQWEEIRKIFPDHASAFAWNYRVPFVPLPLYAMMGRVMAGMGTLAKYSPSQAERHTLLRDDPWPVGLFTLDRCFILTRYPVETGKELVLINTHNSAFDDGSLRKKQMTLLRNTMLHEYEQGNYVVAAGDWNLNPPKRFHETVITGDWIEYINPPIEDTYVPWQWTLAFDPRVPTNRWVTEEYLKGRTFTTIIDFYILSPNIELIEVETLDFGFENSDHNPVRARILLR